MPKTFRNPVRLFLNLFFARTTFPEDLSDRAETPEEELMRRPLTDLEEDPLNRGLAFTIQ